MSAQAQTIRPNFGGRSSQDEALAVVLARLAVAVDPQSVWLFGSRALGAARPDSDFDLLVVGKPGSGLTSDDYEKVDRAINGLGIGCDLAPGSAGDFLGARALRMSFVSHVLTEARCVYEARWPLASSSH